MDLSVSKSPASKALESKTLKHSIDSILHPALGYHELKYDDSRYEQPSRHKRHLPSQFQLHSQDGKQLQHEEPEEQDVKPRPQLVSPQLPQSEDSSTSTLDAASVADGQDGAVLGPPPWGSSASDLSSESLLCPKRHNENVDSDAAVTDVIEFTASDSKYQLDTDQTDKPASTSNPVAEVARGMSPTIDLMHGISSGIVQQENKTVETTDNSITTQEIHEPEKATAPPAKKRRFRTTFSAEQLKSLEENRRAKWRKYERLGNFGGLQDLQEVDYVPAPRTTQKVTSDKKSVKRRTDGASPDIPNSLPTSPTQGDAIPALATVPVAYPFYGPYMGFSPLFYYSHCCAVRPWAPDL
ncbi:hypothetical protein C0Q70_05214 [Pomacea canaliculata]|uniref:Homeobox domain-containing protein n=1 Tax=Pomacea canaliculata TaxID=400727 RepID=A0A2T7PKM6_POMCA|nr:hypothetical protein C0Q70_05214 [Pomacea canaliculata]